MKKTSEAKLRANAKHAKENTVFKGIQLNKNTDHLIISHLQTVKNFQGYIKSLIRKDILENMKNTNEFKVDQLRDEEAFEIFKNKLGEYATCRLFNDVRNIDDFLKRFDEADTSRDIECGMSDAEIYEKFKGDAQVSAYASVEVGSNRFIYLYGTMYCEGYDEDEQAYTESSFGFYDRIVFK